MELPAPFGKYELLDRIATGGMAEVFLARSFGVAGFEKKLVIKRIRPELAQDPRFVGMFINEAKISVHLNHPNVVQVYDLGKVGTSHYIAMEHLHGRDLNRLVKALRAMDERLPLPISVAIVAEMCRGLAYAHGSQDGSGSSVGLVHRDVSPHNLIVTFAGEVKLVDFGIARLINSAQPQEGVEPGRPGGGKYAYMSPEQANGQEVDHRTDIFSAGIVLWELIVGHRLFQDPDPTEKLRRVREAIIPHPQEEGIAIDPGLWSILTKALAKERDDRYTSAALLEEDLRAWLFYQGHRVGRAEVAAEMHRAFPDEPEAGASVDLRRMVADVERLDATLESGVTLTPTAPPSAFLRSLDVENKPVVVLVLDVDGLTALSSRVDPDALFKYHFQLLRWMRRIVDRFGGTVQRAVDDQVLILFGVPRTGADDLARALDCALELQRRAPDLRGKGFSIDLAIGAHSGEVTITPQKGQLRYESRGNTTRLARRLSAIADHGQVLVSERILRAASGAFRLKRGPDLPDRGGRPTDFSYMLEGRRHGIRTTGKGPWLKRGNELEVIRDALVDLGHGKGRALVLLGDEGTGKSRLVREIRDRAQRRHLPIFLGRCLPYNENGVDPFGDLVRDVLGVPNAQDRLALTQALRRLTELGLSKHDMDALATLLGLRDHLADPDDTWQALGRMIAGLAREQPLIIALEELHHVATRHRGRLKKLLQHCSSLPVLLLLTHRGEWPEDLESLVTKVELGPFPAQTQERLMRGMLDADELDPNLVALVERTCEGNPLYLEEMVKFLVDEAAIATKDRVASLVRTLEEQTLPASLAGLVGARIDKLDPASKGALKLAAVLGTHFEGRILAQAAGIDDPTPLITDLMGHALILRSPTGHDHWTFASELVRQVTLRGILGVQRRDYHRLAAAAIETVYPERKEELAENLAQHCAEGGRLLDAARYAYQAGESLERASALERARQCYEKGLAWIRLVPETPEAWDARVQGEAMLALNLGRVCGLLGDSRKAETSLQVALDIASEARIPWVEVRAHVELGRAYVQKSKFNLANAHLSQAREQLTPQDSADLWIETLEAQAALAQEEGRHAEAELLWTDALHRCDGHPAAEARCRLGLAGRHVRAGNFDQAFPLLESALHAARRAADRILEGRVLNNIGLLHTSNGNYSDALANFRRALEVREGIGYTRGVVVNHHNIGDVHFARGDWARAHVAFQRSLDLATESGWERGIAMNETYLGYLDAQRGDVAAGLERLQQSIAQAEASANHDSLATARWLLGRWKLEHGDRTGGIADLEQATVIARQYQLQPIGRHIEQELEAASQGSESKAVDP